MQTCEVFLVNKAGLHARPASKFVTSAIKFKSEIMVTKNNINYNGKSIVSILTMAAVKNEKIIISADGEDEDSAIAELKKIIEDGFGED